MDWSNERYVRVFTRDTPEILMWPWEIDGLWWKLLRKCDRAGVVDLGRCDPALAVAALLRTATAPPLELVREAIAAWTSDGGPAELRELPDGNRLIVIRNFIEAQETPSSDAERKRKSRETRRSLGVSRTGTKRDHESRGVTKSHERSRGVTGGHSVPSRAVPCCTVPEREGAGAPAHGSEQPKAPRRSRRAKPPDHVALGWRIWRELYESAWTVKYADSAACGRVMRATVLAATSVARDTHPDGQPKDATDLEARLEILLRHRFASYLDDPGHENFLNDRRHPLQYFDRGVPTYGLPWGSGARPTPEIGTPPAPPVRAGVAAELADMRERTERGEALPSVEDVVSDARKPLPGSEPRGPPNAAGA